MLRIDFSSASAFYQEATGLEGGTRFHIPQLRKILESFREHVEMGFHQGMSPERRAQIDVVSDLLGQAGRLLEDTAVHAGAPAMLIGATLEEFLRTWAESMGLTLGNRKPGIQTYTDVLYGAQEITKQDVKDLTAWGGLRNSAAHGDWEEVGDRQRIRNVLEAVNLFMRKYSA